MNLQSNVVPTVAELLESHGLPTPSADGVCLWSARVHPVYESVAEVRLMPDGTFQIWHHYGEGSIPWADEVTPAQQSLQDAIEVVHGYQRAISGDGRRANLNS